MKVLVLGGGLAGISAALNLSSAFEVEILEKENRLGGLLKTDNINGFSFDYGPHLFFHQDPYFIEMFDKALKSIGYEKKPAKTGQVSYQKLIDFPYALHLNGLPSDVVSKCVVDFVNAQIGVGSSVDIKTTKNYEDYCRKYFGNGFTDCFMIPYAKKIWTIHPRELDVDWVGERIVLPNLDEVIMGALTPRKLAGNYIKEFRYPKKGGTESFVRGLVSMLGANVHIRPSSEVVRIFLDKKKVELNTGDFLHYDYIINTLPLPELKNIIFELPNYVSDAITKLAWFGVLLINYGGTEIVNNPYQWIYFDQDDYSCHRIHYPSKLANSMTPSEQYKSIQSESSFSSFRPHLQPDEYYVERIWKELGVGGFVSSDKSQFISSRRVKYAYAMMTHDRKTAVRHIHGYLESFGVVSCGRFGDWDYIWTDKVLLSGKRASTKINNISV